MEQIKFFKKPKNLEAGEELFKLFENKDSIFLDALNKVIQGKDWVDEQKNRVNNFSGSLQDYLKLTEINGVSRVGALKILKGLLKEIRKSKKEAISDVEKKKQIYLPLSYIEKINLSEIDLQEGDLWKAYQEFWNSLPDEEKKFYKFKDEIVISRQSPDAKKQAVVEAVSNALDAMRNVQIGEKGLGIKQLLSYVDDGGEIIIKSKKDGDRARLLNIKKGADNDYYSSIKNIDNFPSTSGTIVSVKLKKELTPERIKEIEKQIKYTFRLTLGAQLILNGEVINNYQKIKNLKGKTASEYESTKIVRVDIKNDKIQIIDGGVGMDAKTLSTMFVPRAGTKKMAIKKDKSFPEVWLLEDEVNQGKVFFSRGNEILEDADLKNSKYLNYSQNGLLLEGPNFRVPESRQGIFLDETFLNTINKIVTEILNSNKLAQEKAQLLNSILIYLDEQMQKKNLGDKQKNKEQNSEILTHIKKIKKQAQPLIQELQQEYILLPNHQKWQNLDLDNSKSNKELFYLNERLFDFKIESIPGVERAEYFRGAKVYGVDFKELDLKDNKFIEYRGSYLFDKRVLQIYEQETDDFKKESLEELIELSLNPIITSYDEKEIHILRKILIKKQSVKKNNKEKQREQVETIQNSVLSDLFLKEYKELNKKMGTCHEVTYLENGLFGLRFEKGFVLLDKNSQEKMSIDNMGACYEVTQLENGLIGLGFEHGFVLLDQNSQEKMRIDDMGNCFWLTSLENGLIGLGFEHGFVLLDQNSQEKMRIDDMGNCFWLTSLENGLIGLRFEDGFQTLDYYHFSQKIIGQVNENELVVQIKNIINSLDDSLIDKTDIEEILISRVRNKLKEIEKNEQDFEGINNLLSKPEQLSQVFSYLQKKEQQFQEYQISTYLRNTILSLMTDPKTTEQLFSKLEDNSLQVEMVLSIQKFKLLENNIEEFSNLLKDIDNLYERNFFYSIVDKYLNNIDKSKQDIGLLLDKLSRIKQASIFTTFKSALQGEYNGKSILSYLGKEKDPQMPAGVFLKFLESDINLEIKEAESIIPQKAENIFEESGIDPVELYIIAGQGNVSDEDVIKVLKERRKNKKEISLNTRELIEEQIKKEIRGQSSEEGIYVREIFQNVGDAVLKQNPNVSERNQFNISIWQEQDTKTNQLFFVEKYEDHGIGISSLATLLVAKINNKKDGDAGYFGSGFLSTMEDGDILEIKTSTGNGETKYIQIKIKKGDDQKGVGFDITQYKKINESYQGTTIIRKTEMNKSKITELEFGLLEANILKNTALWQVDLGDGQHIETYLNGTKIEKQSITKQAETFELDGQEYMVKLEQGKFSQVAHGDGLRMSNLEQRYLELVPKQIQDIFKDLNLSIVLDKKLPLIKDRSRLAQEQKFLKKIQKSIARASVKIVAKELLTSRRKFVGWSDDYFNNPNYHLSYDNQDGERIVRLAKQLNSGAELSDSDWQWLSDENDSTSKLARLVVLVEVDYQKEKVTLHNERIKMLQRIQEEIQDSKLFAILQKEKASLENTYTSLSSSNANVYSNIFPSFKKSMIVAMANLEQSENKVDDNNLNQSEKKRLNSLKEIIALLYGNRLKIEVIENSKKAGYFQRNPLGKDIFAINRIILNSSTKNLIKTVVHELAHYEEGTENHGYNFSHQVKGVFGDKYREVCNSLLGLIIQKTPILKQTL